MRKINPRKKPLSIFAPTFSNAFFVSLQTLNHARDTPTKPISLPLEITVK
jgi:hypothetical protein